MVQIQWVKFCSYTYKFVNLEYNRIALCHPLLPLMELLWASNVTKRRICFYVCFTGHFDNCDCYNTYCWSNLSRYLKKWRENLEKIARIYQREKRRLLEQSPQSPNFSSTHLCSGHDSLLASTLCCHSDLHKICIKCCQIKIVAFHTYSAQV